jgi:hypothetical protein
VFSAFAIVDGDGSLSKIEILDAQVHGFHQGPWSRIPPSGHSSRGRRV